MKNKKYLALFQVALLLIVLVCAVLVIKFIQQTMNENMAEQNNSTTLSDMPVSETFILADEKLPVDWAAEIDEANRLLLSNSATGCFIDLSYTTDTPESYSPDVDFGQQTIEAIKAKGYQVVESYGTLTVMSTSGKKVLDAQKLTLTGNDNSLFQEYAYVATADSYTKIQLSCPSSDNLTDAESALLAVEFSSL